MDKKHLYIVLTRTNTVLSRMIGLIKNDEYTHAAISLDKGLCQMYSFGRKNVYNPFVGRFVKEDINSGVYGLCKNLQGLVLEVEISKEEYEKAESLLYEFIINRNSYKYNYFGLLNSLLNKEACYNDRFLCSEFVYYILNKSGISDLGIPRNLVRPQDLLNLNSKVVYKGNLKNVKWSRKIENTIKKDPNYQWVEI
ncbi:hypothetical protein [Sedimentibacter sp. MB31-C6]|uniref:hypothetical protein n=1 Tax=Sedimentibacter sp. MB31-C6 TaxID=3109366 RepID=UPI002DDDB2A3|nr:hypothetical protein [Sedimentibacter sp. MB36-C1]WSI05300.1 hypothetical protein U8307_05765 [Sedimentibacter sp. MB36-C1]